jgi:hypothetical protein
MAPNRLTIAAQIPATNLHADDWSANADHVKTPPAGKLVVHGRMVEAEPASERFEVEIDGMPASLALCRQARR